MLLSKFQPSTALGASGATQVLHLHKNNRNRVDMNNTGGNAIHLYCIDMVVCCWRSTTAMVL